MPHNLLQLRLLLIHKFFDPSLNIGGVPLLVLEVLGPFDLILSEKLLEVAVIHFQALEVVVQITCQEAVRVLLV